MAERGNTLAARRMTDLPEKVVLRVAREVAGCRHIIVGVAPFANERRVALDIVDERRARCCARLLCRSHAACRLDYPFAERLAARDALPQVVPEVGAAAEVWYVPARDLVGRRVSNVHGAV